MSDLSKKVLYESADRFADVFEKSAPMVIGGAAAFIGIASLTHSFMKSQDRYREIKQRELQEKQLKEKRRKSSKDKWVGMIEPRAHVGVVQSMFANRTGHTNTWGGRRY